MNTNVRTSCTEPLYTLSEAQAILDYQCTKTARNKSPRTRCHTLQKGIGCIVCILALVPLLTFGDIVGAGVVLAIGAGMMCTKDNLFTAEDLEVW